MAVTCASPPPRQVWGMDPRLEPLAAILRTNTRLMLNCLEGVDDALAHRRMDDRTNHLAFLGAHLVGARAYLAGLAGGDGTDPFHESLGAANSIDEVEAFPTLVEIQAGWADVTTRVMAALEAVESEALAEAPPFQFPIDDATILGGIAFLVQHDSYHIGQMVLLRKHWGLDAMSYDLEDS